MAYFSNGTEGMSYQAQYCLNCINYRDKNDGMGPGCAIWDAHLFYAYDECNSNSNAKSILDMLIPMDKATGFAAECSMFIQSDE